jgi:hypothetical protein
VTAKSIQTTETRAAPCPSCGKVLSAITGTATPKPGAITLCAYCRVFLIVTDTMQVRLLLNREWLALPTEQQKTLTALREGLAVRR